MNVRAVAVVLALAAASVAAWRLWPGEERKVRGRLAALAETLSVPPREEGLGRVARASAVRKFFTQDVAVELPAGGPSGTIRGPDEIAGIVSRMTVPPEGTQVQLVSVQIDIAPDEASADVRVSARVVAREPRENPPILDARMVALTMNKKDGAWLIANARIMPTDDSLGVR